MKPGLWAQLLLVVSLAFNIAAVIVYLQPRPAPHPRTPEEFIERVTRHMSAIDTAALRSSFDKFAPQLREKRQANEQAMQHVRETLEATPFNADDLSAAMSDARQAHAASERVFQASILDAAPRLSPDGRAALMPPDHGDGPSRPAGLHHPAARAP